MSVEMIIHYNSGNTEEELYATLKSLYDHNNIPDKIRLCVNPPVEKNFLYFETISEIKKIIKKDIECNLQIFTYKRDKIESVINDAVQLVNADYYVFVNAGYIFTNSEIMTEINNKNVIFAEGVDDCFNEFSCNVKLHKYLGGFGDHYSLIEKIEYKLKSLEEAKNGTATSVAEGGSDNL